MKKLTILILLFAACKATDQDGLYIKHTDGQYSITDDTLEVRDTVIIEHTGYQRIRNGVAQPKEYKTKTLCRSGIHQQRNFSIRTA